MPWSLRSSCIVMAAIVFMVIYAHGTASADELTLLESHLYRLASFTEGERSDVLATMRKSNPQLVITDLTRNSNSVRIHFGMKGYIEILRSELYSLTSFIPHGIEGEITRRSRGELLVGRIRKTGAGISISMGDAG
jgi:hypothetical protein